MRRFWFLIILVVAAEAIYADSKCQLIYQSGYPEVSIERIVRHDTATIVHMRRIANPGDVFVLTKRQLYLDDEQGKKYRLKGTEGISQGDTIRHPLSGILDFSLIFEPLAKNVKIFDLRAANEAFSTFAFWGIHEKDNILKKIKHLKDKNIRLDKEQIFLNTGTAVIRGQIRNYTSSKPDTCQLFLVFQKDDYFRHGEFFKSAVSKEGCFEFCLPVENMCWSYIEGKHAVIPVVFYPNDTLEVTIDKLGEIDMTVSYRSLAGNNIMQKLMQADPMWTDWELAGKRSTPVAPSMLAKEMQAKKNETTKLVEYLTWKHGMSQVESHLLQLKINSFINEISITRLRKTILGLYPSTTELLNKPEELSRIEQQPEIQESYEFLKEIDPEDYSYFILPSEYLLSHLPGVVLYYRSDRNQRYGIIERYIGKPLDDLWRKRIVF